MKKQNFLSELKRTGKLRIVEPSEEICSSYLEKSNNCLISAKILLKNKLYENSVSEAYYAMYNSLTALLFRTGINQISTSVFHWWIICLEILSRTNHKVNLN